MPTQGPSSQPIEITNVTGLGGGKFTCKVTAGDGRTYNVSGTGNYQDLSANPGFINQVNALVRIFSECKGNLTALRITDGHIEGRFGDLYKGEFHTVDNMSKLTRNPDHATHHEYLRKVITTIRSEVKNLFFVPMSPAEHLHEQARKTLETIRSLRRNSPKPAPAPASASGAVPSGPVATGISAAPSAPAPAAAGAAPAPPPASAPAQPTIGAVTPAQDEEQAKYDEAVASLRKHLTDEQFAHLDGFTINGFIEEMKTVEGGRFIKHFFTSDPIMERDPKTHVAQGAERESLTRMHQLMYYFEPCCKAISEFKAYKTQLDALCENIEPGRQQSIEAQQRSEALAAKHEKSQALVARAEIILKQEETSFKAAPIAEKRIAKELHAILINPDLSDADMKTVIQRMKGINDRYFGLYLEVIQRSDAIKRESLPRETVVLAAIKDQGISSDELTAYQRKMTEVAGESQA